MCRVLLTALGETYPHEYANWLNVRDEAEEEEEEEMDTFVEWVGSRYVFVETPEFNAFREAIITKVYMMNEENSVMRLEFHSNSLYGAQISSESKV